MKKKLLRRLSKRLVAYVIDSLHYSFRIIIFLIWLYITIGNKEQLLPLEILFNYCFSILLSGIIFILSCFQILFFQVNEATYNGVFRLGLMLLIIAILRSIFISFYESRHEGYSRGGKRMRLQVVREDERKCTFIILFIRNIVLFTGGCTLFFLPCIPFFDSGKQSLIDKILKVKVIECENKPNIHSALYKELLITKEFFFGKSL